MHETFYRERNPGFHAFADAQAELYFRYHQGSLSAAWVFAHRNPGHGGAFHPAGKIRGRRRQIAVQGAQFGEFHGESPERQLGRAMQARSFFGRRIEQSPFAGNQRERPSVRPYGSVCPFRGPAPVRTGFPVQTVPIAAGLAGRQAPERALPGILSMRCRCDRLGFAFVPKFSPGWPCG